MFLHICSSYMLHTCIIKYVHLIRKCLSTTSIRVYNRINKLILINTKYNHDNTSMYCTQCPVFPLFEHTLAVLKLHDSVHSSTTETDLKTLELDMQKTVLLSVNKGQSYSFSNGLTICGLTRVKALNKTMCGARECVESS